MLRQELLVGVGNVFGHATVGFFDFLVVAIRAFVLADGVGNEFQLLFRQLVGVVLVSASVVGIRL